MEPVVERTEGESLAARLRHLVPRRLRERYYLSYVLMTGKSQAAVAVQSESEQLSRAIRRVDLFGELMDQRMHRLEARVSKLEDQLTDVERARTTGDEVPLDDRESYAFELAYRADRAAVANRYLAVASMLEPGSEVLELGSGTGTFLQTCQDLGHRAVGVDRSEVMVSTAVASGLEATVDDAVSFLERQPDESFDCIAAFHLVEHLPGERLRVLCSEAHRVLRSGGQFVLETPNVGSMKTMLTYYYVDPSHRRPRRVEQYLYVLERAGFSEVKVDVIAAGDPTDQPARPAPGIDHIAPVEGAPDTVNEECTGEPSRSRELGERLSRLEELLEVASDIRLYAQK